MGNWFYTLLLFCLDFSLLWIKCRGNNCTSPDLFIRFTFVLSHGVCLHTCLIDVTSNISSYLNHLLWFGSYGDIDAQCNVLVSIFCCQVLETGGPIRDSGWSGWNQCGKQWMENLHCFEWWIFCNTLSMVADTGVWQFGSLNYGPNKLEILFAWLFWVAVAWKTAFLRGRVGLYRAFSCAQVQSVLHWSWFLFLYIRTNMVPPRVHNTRIGSRNGSSRGPNPTNSQRSKTFVRNPFLYMVKIDIFPAKWPG